MHVVPTTYLYMLVTRLYMPVTRLYMPIARLYKPANQLYCAWLQADMEGSPCLAVALQLSRWGFLPELRHFVQEFQAAYQRRTGGQQHMGLLCCLADREQLQAKLHQVTAALTIGFLLPCALGSKPCRAPFCSDTGSCSESLGFGVRHVAAMLLPASYCHLLWQLLL